MTVRQGVAVPLTQAGLIALGLGTWELAAQSGWIDARNFSSPSLIYTAILFLYSEGDLLFHVQATLKVLGLGFGSAVIVGMTMGILLGISASFRAYVEPFLVFVNALPRSILVPVFIIWFGFGMAPKVLAVFLVAVFFITINVSTGVRTLEGEFVVNARMLGADWRNLATNVYIPGVALWLLGSARVAFGYAFQAAIVAEFFGAFLGLGYVIVRAQGAFSVHQIYGALVVTLMIAFTLDRIAAAVESRSTRWMGARA